jgi:mannose-6-phosphate isomerase
VEYGYFWYFCGKIISVNTLYPLKFKPQPKETVWGGHKLNTLLYKGFSAEKKIGESWELSGVQKNLSVVTNGHLKGNSIEELAEIYMGELLGDKVYEQFSVEFPLLIKFIDASDTLSVQVHPADAVAAERHGAYGKTEMWVVLAAEPGAGLYVGFKEQLTAQAFYAHTQKGTLPEVLNFEPVAPGDVFFIPAGRIHAIGKGVLLAEIQQTSDITYRVYDWGREYNPATARDMHIDLAIDVIDYAPSNRYKTRYAPQPNVPVNLATCPYFTTNLLEIDHTVERPLLNRDSFVIYICLEGSATLVCKGGAQETVTQGETLLVPAAIADTRLQPVAGARLLEVYV